MKRDKEDRGTWSRREVFRVGGMASAAGVGWPILCCGVVAFRCGRK
jgi:hypothetical protein